MQTTIGERLKFLLNSLNLSARKFSREIGVAENNTQNYLPPNEREPGAAYLARVVLHFESINAYWLLTGKGEAFAPNVAAQQTIQQTSQKNSGSQIIGQVGGNATHTQGASASELAAAQRELKLLHSQLADKERIIRLLEAQLPKP